MYKKVAMDLESKKREIEILKEEIKNLNFEVTKQTQVIFIIFLSFFYFQLISVYL